MVYAVQYGLVSQTVHVGRSLCSDADYLRRRLASEGTVLLSVTMSRCVCVRHAAAKVYIPLRVFLVFYCGVVNDRSFHMKL